ncbi:MAG: UDP-N-acetylmuramate--L-alanine ligase [Romboutsia sp.]|nr:UDP-N-acetylmuramate--L-alanine ligase [Romboutsia sp.]
MHIFFIGIGGISMSALAKICLNKGYKVSGSDASNSASIDELRRLGANINIGHSKENITDDISMVVYTAAVKSDNVEMVEAKNKNILTLNRAVFLGQIMREYENPIAVSGTHGKTTTTSMLSAIFGYANLDPTILVGGNLNIIGGNVKIGSSKYFITEACEYVDSFLNFNPKVSIVLNIEEDHLDYFSGLSEIKASFNKFGKLLPSDGYFIINGDNENTKDILYDVQATVIKFGTQEYNDVVIKNIVYDENGFGEFELEFKNLGLKVNDVNKFKLSVPGKHNIYNATAAIVASLVSDVDIEDIKKNISLYTGVGRRFETKGYYKDVKVIDDYAHHPTELKETLATAKKVTKGELWCIFQPHTYSRTKALLNEFEDAFYSADRVIITDIYAARETNTVNIHSTDLVDRLYQNGVNASYIGSFEDIVSYMKNNVNENDLVITAGAGHIYQVAEMLVNEK